jgi:hypothetical protein
VQEYFNEVYMGNPGIKRKKPKMSI